jgi:hypothetical protein
MYEDTKRWGGDKIVGSSPGQINPKTIKLVSVASLLSAQL